MNKSIISHIFAFLVMTCMVACTGGDDDDSSINQTFEWGDVQVTSFSLQKDDSVLSNLDTVFFSIDLNNGRIYNPDSLPKGTRINRLLINVTYAMVSKAQIKWRTAEGADSIKDYVATNNDSIDFSNGPVILRLTSLDEKVTRDYSIQVNVHQTNPDSLSWGSIAYARLPLPEGTAALTAQRTVRDGEKVACFMLTADNELFVARNADQQMNFAPAENMSTVPDGFDINTLTISDDSSIYAIADGRLVKYTESGWTDLSTPMTWIYGVYEGKLIGCRPTADGGYEQCTWPASATATVLPTDFPVSGASDMMVYTSEWTTSPMGIIIGGRKADQSLTGAVWAYDGGQWAQISGGIPAAEGIALVPYFTLRLGKYWDVTERTAIFAIGGLMANDTCQTTIYASNDRGMHWYKAPAYLQLPEEIAPRYGAQAVMMEQTMQVGSRATSTDWTELFGSSRATRPVTEWECPYIYIFGGKSDDGMLYDQIWRGVINRMSYAPLF